MRKYIFLLLGLFFFSCGNSEITDKNPEAKDTVTVTNKIIDGDYEFAQGGNIEESKKILIVVIDPHGDGKLAVSKFQKIVENYNCTVIGLNDVENGQQDFIGKIKNDINSAIADLELNVEQIYLAGFSGGAKMGFYYALENGANGVLMDGASVAEIWSQNNFPLATVVGTQDFSFESLYYSPFTSASSNENFLNLVFEGKHEWASEEYISKAFAFLFAKNNKIISDIDYFSEYQKYLQENKDYFAFKSLEAGLKTYGEDKFSSEIDKLLQKEDFIKYMQNYEQILFAGANRNGDYMKKLPTQNITWWTDEITEIEKLSNNSDKLIGDSYMRTKALLGIAMYSYVANELNNPNSIYIDKYLQIYELLEPENPDLLAFKEQRLQQKK